MRKLLITTVLSLWLAPAQAATVGIDSPVDIRHILYTLVPESIIAISSDGVLPLGTNLGIDFGTNWGLNDIGTRYVYNNGFSLLLRSGPNPASVNDLRSPISIPPITSLFTRIFFVDTVFEFNDIRFAGYSFEFNHGDFRSIPAPSALVLFLSALASLLLWRRKP